MKAAARAIIQVRISGNGTRLTPRPASAPPDYLLRSKYCAAPVIGTVMLYCAAGGPPVVAGCGLPAAQEPKGAAALLEDTSVNRPASAFHEMITLLPERVTGIVGRGAATGAGWS